MNPKLQSLGHMIVPFLIIGKGYLEGFWLPRKPKKLINKVSIAIGASVNHFWPYFSMLNIHLYFRVPPILFLGQATTKRLLEANHIVSNLWERVTIHHYLPLLEFQLPLFEYLLDLIFKYHTTICGIALEIITLPVW